MDANIKMRWVTLLRRPDARQGAGRLGYEDGRRCSLGVLCDLAVEDGVITKWLTECDQEQVWVYGIPGADDHEIARLPATVMTWAGLGSCSPFIGPEMSAVVANDIEGWTFPRIAEAIESFC